MSKRLASTFKQGDVTRLIKAVKLTGLPVSKVTVDPKSGAITVVTADAAEQDSEGSNEWDKI